MKNCLLVKTHVVQRLSFGRLIIPETENSVIAISVISDELHQLETGKLYKCIYSEIDESYQLTDISGKVFGKITPDMLRIVLNHDADDGFALLKKLTPTGGFYLTII